MRSFCKETAELNKRIREADGVKTSCDTSIVASAGRPASLHSGEKFPILVGMNGDNATFDLHKFGNLCELVASHLDANRLRVGFQAESSQRDDEHAAVIAGFTCPGFTSCYINTQVELNLSKSIVVLFPGRNPGTPKAKADAASQPGEPPVTLFTLTPLPVETRRK